MDNLLKIKGVKKLQKEDLSKIYAGEQGCANLCRSKAHWLVNVAGWSGEEAQAYFSECFGSCEGDTNAVAVIA